jgi:hypothetical protein
MPSAPMRRSPAASLPSVKAGELASLYEPMAGYLTEHIATFTDEQLRLVTDFARSSAEIALREAGRLRRDGKPHSTRKPRSA